MSILIKKIENYGCFGNARNLTEIDNESIIYAPNGTGKSTLSNLFYSLAYRKNELIIKKRTIGIPDSSSIKLNMDIWGVNCKFDSSTGWKRGNGLINIQVFNSQFIVDNLYIGNYGTNDDLSSNLTGIVFGNINVQITKNTMRIEELDSQNKSIVDSIKEHFKTTYNFTPMLTTPNINYINGLNKVYKRELKTRLSLIPLIDKLKDINIITILKDESIFEKSKSILEMNIGDNIFEILKKANLKIQSLKIDWLKEGYSLIKNDVCPFCQRNNLSSESEVYNIYKRIFNDAFYKETTDLSNQVKTTKLELSNMIFKIEELYNFTSKIDGISSVIKFSTFSNYIELLKKLYNFFEEKQKNPTDKISISDLLKKIKVSSKKLEEIFEKVLVFKENNELKIVKGNVNNCCMYNGRKNKIGSLILKYIKNESENEKIKEQIKALHKKVDIKQFNNIEKKINYFLDRLYLSNKIEICIQETAESRFNHKDNRHVRTKYSIKFKKYSNVEKESQEAIKNILSEGEQNAIGLAFFLAVNTDFEELPTGELAIDIKTGLPREKNTVVSKKLLIIDDPISSLDGIRKYACCSELCNLVLKHGNYIMLTHSTEFMRIFIETNYEGVKKFYRLINGDFKPLNKDQILNTELNNFIYKFKKIVNYSPAGKIYVEMIPLLTIFRRLCELYYEEIKGQNYKRNNNYKLVSGAFYHIDHPKLTNDKKRVLCRMINDLYKDLFDVKKSFSTRIKLVQEGKRLTNNIVDIYKKQVRKFRKIKHNDINNYFDELVKTAFVLRLLMESKMLDYFSNPVQQQIIIAAHTYGQKIAKLQALNLPYSEILKFSKHRVFLNEFQHASRNNDYIITDMEIELINDHIKEMSDFLNIL